MFQAPVRKSKTRSGFAMLELIFHVTVRNLRKNSGTAVMGLLLSILQALIMIGMFLLMFSLLGMRSAAIRGDYTLYLMSGIFMFTTHVRTISSVSKAEGPTSPMMKHSTMNPIVVIMGAALASLYQQVFAAAVILFVYDALISPLTFDQPVQAMGMLLLGWGTGLGVGMIFKALMPWNPTAFTMISSIYQRLNMIASGKMFVANMMPTSLLAMFDWNPLFHVIDQGRGFIFLNYNPRYSSIEYPIKVMLVCIVIGLMGEFYTRKFASLSWTAGK
jgi:ABC-type polysaccharide/polyol phosphate export permease